MAEIENQEVSQESTTIERVPPAGELKLLALLLIIGLAFLVDSFNSSGIFQGDNSGSGTIAQIISLALVLFIIGRAIVLLKSGHKEGSLKDAQKFLLARDVVLIIGMILLYGCFVEMFHFVPTSLVFLIISMYMLEKKNLVKKTIVSCLYIGALYLIFNTAFQVVLP